MRTSSFYEKQYVNWDKKIDNFRNALFTIEGIENTTNDEFEKLSCDLHEILSTLLTHFANKSGVRDNFNEPRLGFISHGQSVELESEKMNTRFSFGIYQNSFYLETYFQHPFYLKSMDDTFWQYFVNLTEFGNFSFQENAVPVSEAAKSIDKCLGKCKSNIFNLIKNYILLENSGSSVDLGSLEVSWPINIAWPDLIKNGTKAFTNLHKINYLLYRRYYINLKRR